MQQLQVARDAAEAREQALLSTYDAERKAMVENVALKAEVARLTAALAASRAASDCHQQDLVTAVHVRVKPLVWVRHWEGCYTVKSLKTEDNACDVVYYAERAEKTGYIVNTVTKPGYFRCWVDFGEEFESLEAAKAAAQADYEARILAALDLTPAPAVGPRTVIGGDASVAVCPICDIAGCKHVRGEAPAVEPVALTYTNWRGETSVRTIIPRGVWFGSTEWHPEPQWMLQAFDTEKGADRDFALKDFGSRTQTAQDAARVPEIAALIEAAEETLNEYWGQTHGPIIDGMKKIDAALRAIGGDA